MLFEGDAMRCRNIRNYTVIDMKRNLNDMVRLYNANVNGNKFSMNLLGKLNKEAMNRF